MAQTITRTELTDRELQVLCLVAEGLNNSQIGRKLGVAQDTVKTHLKHISIVLCTHNQRAALVTAGFRAGLLA